MAKLLAFICIIFSFVSVAHAQQDEQFFYKAEVTKVETVTPENPTEEPDGTVTVTVKLKNGAYKGQTVVTSWNNDTATSRIFQVAEDDNLIVACAMVSNELTCSIVDQQRSSGLLILLGVFLLTIWFVARKHGLMAFLSLIFGLFVIVSAMIPLILNGAPPLLVAILAGLIIIVPSIYLSHGFNAQSHIALASIGVATIIIAVLATVFSALLHLHGSIGEESLYIQENINLKSLLLGAIVLGAFGVIDDIAMTQVSIVNELHHSNKKLSAYALFKRAMQVGRDHIASVINTLFLAYIGVGLPLLVLLRQNDLPLMVAIQQEPLATEIMRTLVGTTGLILVVPLATYLAAQIITRRPELFPEKAHHHIH